MNKDYFKKLVTHYLMEEVNTTRTPNFSKILEIFKPVYTQDEHILVENKLIYILGGPEDLRGYFVFSDEYTTYIWSSMSRQINTDDWYETDSHSGWSNKHHWIVRGEPLSGMNKGKGWNHGCDATYYILEVPLEYIKGNYLNWRLRDPLNLK